jgi:hypothetical protein
VVAVNRGYSAALAIASRNLTSTGPVLAWGYNADGEPGNGATSGIVLPVDVNLPYVRQGD